MNMKKRIISGFFIVLILAISIIKGGSIFSMVISFCAICGLHEFISIRGKNKKIEGINLISYIALLFITLNNTFYNIDMSSLICFSILGLGVPLVITNDKDKYNIYDLAYYLGSILILGIAFNSLIMFRDKNIYLCIYIFLISFMTDTYAYIGGMLIGKNKLTTISPKKTIEGSIVGSIMACIIGTVFYDIMIGDMNLYMVILTSLLLSIISQFGELFFSSIKRYFDKKDYSNLIPGHGGILDRFDSVIFVTLLLKLILNIF